MCKKCGCENPWRGAGEDLRKPTAASDGYAQGDKVRLLKNIWDNGEDHHPPGYLAYKGEVLIVRSGTGKSGVLAISHEHITNNAFTVTLDEVERA